MGDIGYFIFYNSFLIEYGYIAEYASEWTNLNNKFKKDVSLPLNIEHYELSSGICTFSRNDSWIRDNVLPCSEAWCDSNRTLTLVTNLVKNNYSCRYQYVVFSYI